MEKLCKVSKLAELLGVGRVVIVERFRGSNVSTYNKEPSKPYIPLSQ